MSSCLKGMLHARQCTRNKEVVCSKVVTPNLKEWNEAGLWRGVELPLKLRREVFGWNVTINQTLDQS